MPKTVLKGGDVEIHVCYDLHWQEFICKPRVAGKFLPEATYYHTDDREDALGTAKVMLAEQVALPTRKTLTTVRQVFHPTLKPKSTP